MRTLVAAVLVSALGGFAALPEDSEDVGGLAGVVTGWRDVRFPRSRAG